MMALPNSALDTTYWLPWYNNADLDTQLRCDREVRLPRCMCTLAGWRCRAVPSSLAAGESTRKSFPGSTWTSADRQRSEHCGGGAVDLQGQ